MCSFTAEFLVFFSRSETWMTASVSSPLSSFFYFFHSYLQLSPHIVISADVSGWSPTGRQICFFSFIISKECRCLSERRTKMNEHNVQLLLHLLKKWKKDQKAWLWHRDSWGLSQWHFLSGSKPGYHTSGSKKIKIGPYVNNQSLYCIYSSCHM